MAEAKTEPDNECSEDLDQEDQENDTQLKAFVAQKSAAFYTDAAAYWDKVPATVNGMLGGFAHISTCDLSGSDLYLKSIFKMKNPPGHGRAVDCGAGIGRITKHLLQKHFGKVDLVEQCQNFIDRAKENFRGSNKIGEFICSGLQNFSPAPNTYDVVWCQWVLGHLTDADLQSFFMRMGRSLKPNGVIIVKENVTSSNEVELDEEDSSVTRTEELLLDIIERSEMKVFKNTKQPKFPKELYEVKIMCLRPKQPFQ